MISAVIKKKLDGYVPVNEFHVTFVIHFERSISSSTAKSHETFNVRRLFTSQNIFNVFLTELRYYHGYGVVWAVIDLKLMNIPCIYLSFPESGI